MSQRQSFLLRVLVVVFLLSLPLPLLADQLTGKIASVAPEKREFVVTENFKNWTFQLARDGKIFLNGRESSLFELQAGDTAIITFTREGERLMASSVQCMRK